MSSLEEFLKSLISDESKVGAKVLIFESADSFNQFMERKVNGLQSYVVYSSVEPEEYLKQELLDSNVSTFAAIDKDTVAVWIER